MIEFNLKEIGDGIARACDSVGRDPASVTLVAVTKTVPVETIQCAYDLGLRTFGESRLQEAIPKIEALPSDIDWHFIGVLQSNKAKRITESFGVIHTLDSDSQLREIAKANRIAECLIEVNIAKEPQKSGIFPEDLDAFRLKVLQCPCVRLRGLMTIGPANRNAEEIRPLFRAMQDLNHRMGGDWLSMGMSGDFEVAIQEGATHVRIGSALFGERH